MTKQLKNFIAIVTLGFALALPLTLSGDASSGAASDDTSVLDSTRSTLSKWVETQQIIAKEKKDWQFGREVLDQRIALLESEMASIDEKIGQIDEGLHDANGRQKELVVKRQDLKDASATLARKIGSLEAGLKRLVITLPDPLAQKVSPLVQRIPSNPGKTELTLGSRFQSVVGVLNEINKFNGDITLATEVLKLPSGVEAEVQSIYVGLGQAYYVTVNRDAAGVGVPTPEGWTWKASNELAAQIAQVVAILQNDSVPAYVPLPVTIQ